MEIAIKVSKDEKERRFKIPLTSFVAISKDELAGLENKIEALEREFKKELTTKEIRSRIDGHKLAQIAETATEKALAEKIQENDRLRHIIEVEHGRNLQIA